MDSNFLSDNKVLEAIPHTAAGTSEIEGTIIDTSGFEGIAFAVQFSVGAADNTILVEQGAESNLSDKADLEGSLNTPGNTEDNLVTAIYRPQKQYVRVVAQRGTSTTVGGFAVMHGAAVKTPDSDVSGTLQAEQLIAPDEGTA